MLWLSASRPAFLYRCGAVACPQLRAFSGAPPPPHTGVAGFIFRVNRSVAIAANTLGPYTAMAVGSCVVVYGVSSLALHLSTSILSLTLTDALYGGFGAGFLSCGILAAAALRFHRSVTLHPDAVFKLALARVAGDARVAAAIGASVKAGALQAYNLVPGHVRCGALPAAPALRKAAPA
jgi:hypothetical protein